MAAEDDQHDALMAVARALTEDENAAILARSSRWPGMAGAEVADVLAHTVSSDEFLRVTEPFYEEHGAELARLDGSIYAVHALILMREPLTVASVTALLDRARPPAGVSMIDSEREADTLKRVNQALTDGEAVTITHAAVDAGFPLAWLPAPIPLVLHWLADTSQFLDLTTPFFEEHAAELPDDFYPIFAMVALCALGRPLTMDTVTDLMRRARDGETPYDPVPDLAEVVCWARRDARGHHPSMMSALARLDEAGVGGTPEGAEARIRALMVMGQ